MSMEFVPHAYQSRAVDHVIDNERCLLLLDMGLGKTVITLTAVRRLMWWGDVRRVLVVAPAMVAATTWSDEAAKWRHTEDMRVIPLAGTPGKREKLLSMEADVNVISRDLFVWLVSYYRRRRRRWPWDMIVLDELTSFKSPDSSRFRAMRSLTGVVSRVVGLTGTPAPNGMQDLWAQVYCIDGGKRLEPTYTRFKSEYFDVYRIQNWEKLSLKKGSEARIRAAISDIALSMRAADWLTLPPCTVSDFSVELPPKGRRAYDELRRELLLEFGDGSGVTADSAAVLTGKLSQLANGGVYDADGTVHEVHTVKTEALREIVEAADTPVLCFYQYRHDAERILRAFKGHFTVEMYNGAEMLRKWNNGTVRLLLAHPASCAYGLNMQQGGRHVVWYSTGYNLEQYLQANARLHRQGQSRPVTVTHICARGTVDEAMLAALRDKKGVQEVLMAELRKKITGE